MGSVAHLRRGIAAGPALVLLLASAAAAQEPEPRLGSGPAALAGLGYSTGGGVGLGLAWYQRLGQRPFYVAPHLGAGVKALQSPELSAHGWCAGAWFVYGHRHRVLLSADYGVFRHESLSLHGSFVAWRAIQGPQLGLGYEWVRANGFVFQLVPVFAYPVRGVHSSFERKIDYLVNIYAGWKIW